MKNLALGAIGGLLRALQTENPQLTTDLKIITFDLYIHWITEILLSACQLIARELTITHSHPLESSG